jgi:hypothetical protein
MDKSYKDDIPKARRALEELKKEFSEVASTTDWTQLRIEPLLDHVRSLERVLRSPKFARETARFEKRGRDVPRRPDLPAGKRQSTEGDPSG